MIVDASTISAKENQATTMQVLKIEWLIIFFLILVKSKIMITKYCPYAAKSISLVDWMPNTNESMINIIKWIKVSVTNFLIWKIRSNKDNISQPIE